MRKFLCLILMLTMLIIPVYAEEIADEKRLRERSEEVKEHTNRLYERKDKVRNVLDRIANDFGKASLNFPVFFVDSVMNAKFSPYMVEYVGLDEVRKPMISILGQCAEIITDVIEKAERRPKSRGIIAREKIKKLFVRPESERLVEAFRKAKAIMGMV